MRRRLDLLGELIHLTEQRVPPELTTRAREIAQRADQRLALGEQTVVALAGATGSGKSSLTNALAGTGIATTGVRRPTTSQSLAISFSATNRELLDWLGIPSRHEVPAPEPGLASLVLLDLPDHDSVVSAHREEVDRLVELVDQFVWVLDPQKYADAAVHDGYLRPLAQHSDVVTVVLNQVDRLPADGVAECLGDLRRLLDADGLPGVPLRATSTRTGEGTAELRRDLAAIAARKAAARARLTADLDLLVAGFREACHASPARPEIPEQARAELGTALEAAAGVPELVTALRLAMIHRGALATGWPVLSWLRRLRPDPLARLRPGGRPEVGQGSIPEHSALPDKGPIARARLRTGVRGLADAVGDQLPPDWSRAVHRAVTPDLDELADQLDQAVLRTDLGATRIPLWWRVLRGLQWLLVAAVVLGLGWLVGNAALTQLGITSGAAGPIPVLLVLGGLLSGMLLGAGGQVLIRLGARSEARRARRRLHRAVVEVGRRHVVEPLTEELHRLDRARQLIRKLGG